MIYLAQFLSKSFEKQDIFCYTLRVNTGRNVMAQFSFRQGLVTLFGAMTFGLASCDKGDPINPSGGNTNPDPIAKVDTVDSILQVYPNASSAVMGESITKDGKRYFGFNARISEDVNDTKVTTGASGYDNMKYKVKYFRENMKKGAKSTPGGEYYIAADSTQKPVMSYEPADGKYFKIVPVTVGNQTTYHRIKRADVFVESKDGLRIMGSTITDDAAFNDRLDNVASQQSAELSAKLNVLDLNATSKSKLVVMKIN
ncbi:hypothetical protein [Emticicia sp. BO119]|uniref:hypothetical protein n=1 Tax=Emticicia sp. BO119 TaxID=2757768 RepID=UPI0015EFEACF|nr:hypothetical protein [Emticicia sp. BO119]MBA4853771.1 hypothetical protein [Emticicia sp. BO119]